MDLTTANGGDTSKLSDRFEELIRRIKRKTGVEDIQYWKMTTREGNGVIHSILAGTLQPFPFPLPGPSWVDKEVIYFQLGTMPGTFFRKLRRPKNGSSSQFPPSPLGPAPPRRWSCKAIGGKTEAVEALQMAWERAEKRSVKSSQVFPGRKGPLNDVREILNGACKRAGVPHIRVHGLRHTFGSQMAMAGANPFAIMKALGYEDIKVTMPPPA